MSIKRVPTMGQKVKALRVRGAEDNNGVIGAVIRLDEDNNRFTIRPESGPTWIVRTNEDEWLPFFEGEAMIGKHVKVTKGSPARLVGMTGTITSIYRDTDEVWAYMEPDEGFEKGPHAGGGWVIYGWDFFHPSHDETIPADLHHAQVERLEGEVETLKKALKDANDRVEEFRVRPQAIVTCIGEHLIQAATDNDMCSVYDEEVDDANRKLSKWGVALPLRHQEWTVDMIEYVLVGVRRSFTVSARDAEGARDAAQSDADDSKLSDDDVIEAIRDYNDPEFERYSPRSSWNVELAS